mmetsp:Transcript_22445/g.63723  ORF Transcript_22445/g.63723 Transcript_22445/m.63723 type:complete len:217 (+) Transcript_22445:243-893(+)
MDPVRLHLRRRRGAVLRRLLPGAGAAAPPGRLAPRVPPITVLERPRVGARAAVVAAAVVVGAALAALVAVLAAAPPRASLVEPAVVLAAALAASLAPKPAVAVALIPATLAALAALAAIPVVPAEIGPALRHLPRAPAIIEGRNLCTSLMKGVVQKNGNVIWGLDLNPQIGVHLEQGHAVVDAIVGPQLVDDRPPELVASQHVRVPNDEHPVLCPR